MRGVPLGEALIRLGFVKPEDVEAALAKQVTDRRKLGEILMASGKVTRDQIDRAMALQMGMGVFNAQDGVDASVATLIDEKVARRYQAVPVRFDADGMLVVAMVDPTNLHAVDDLQIVTGHTIRPARATVGRGAAAPREHLPHRRHRRDHGGGRVPRRATTSATRWTTPRS